MSSKVKYMELVLIKDKLEQALALAIAGDHIVSDEIRDAIIQCRHSMQEIRDEENATSDNRNQSAQSTVNINRALADSGLSALRVAKA